MSARPTAVAWLALPKEVREGWTAWLRSHDSAHHEERPYAAMADALASLEPDAERPQDAPAVVVAVVVAEGVLDARHGAAGPEDDPAWEAGGRRCKLTLNEDGTATLERVRTEPER
jgi:hypothetical protein